MSYYIDRDNSRFAAFSNDVEPHYTFRGGAAERIIRRISKEEKIVHADSPSRTAEPVLNSLIATLRERRESQPLLSLHPAVPDSAEYSFTEKHESNSKNLILRPYGISCVDIFARFSSRCESCSRNFFGLRFRNCSTL